MTHLCIAALLFIQICDPHIGDKPEYAANLRAAVEVCNNLKPAFVVICGDCVHVSDDRAAMQTFGDIISGLKMPCHVVMGNHDITSTASLALYRISQTTHMEPDEKWRFIEYGDYGIRQTAGGDYYSVDYQDWRLIVVNTVLMFPFFTVGGEPYPGLWITEMRWCDSIDAVPIPEILLQAVWLGQELERAAMQGKRVIIAGHHPVYNISIRESSRHHNLPRKMRGGLLRLYKEHGVEVILSGHTHTSNTQIYEGMLMVTGETTSWNADGKPPGVRVWTINGKDIQSRFVEMSEEKGNKP